MYVDLYSFCYGIVYWLFVDIVGPIVGWLGAHGLQSWVGRSDVLGVLATILIAIIVFIAGFLINITMIWQERKMLGRIMDRRATMVGPLGYFQNIADGLKTFLKEIIIPESADEGIFNAAPIIVIGSSILLLATIPLSSGFYMSNVQLGVLFTLAIFGIAPFGILLGGWASNNKYTLIGGMRAAAQLIAYEVPMLLCVASVVILSGSLNFGDIVNAQNNVWYCIPLFIGFVVFFVSVTAEAERVPFDLPEAEAELVEGWGTEYPGMRFGLLMLSDYFRGYAASALVVLLFLGGWIGPFPNLIPQEAWFLLKTFIVFFIMIWIRAALPRVRIDQILNIGWKKLLPLAVINLFIAVLLKSMGWF